MLAITKLNNRFILSALGILVLGLISQFASAHGMSEADKQAIIEGGNLRYMWLGATHMLTGYDHLAFVFGIVFFLKSFRDIAKYVTAFTLGHSATLIYATFNGIQLNYFLIDAVIALSVCYIAFANIDGFRKYLNIKPPNMMLMITGLGFIHGFGLSTRLQELPLSEDGLLLNIISFNVGIELGQISALALMLVLIAAWRKSQSFQTFSQFANYGLILAGSFLFIMQMNDYINSSDTQKIISSAVASQFVSDEKIADDLNQTTPSTIQWEDSIVITIPPRTGKEYKFYLDKGANLEYMWQTDGNALFFDLHGEPTGDTTGYFKSFKKSTQSQQMGNLTTDFAGPHGWYWKNSSSSPVMITLNTRGQYQRLDLEKQLDSILGDSILNTRENNSTTHDSL